MKKYTLYILAIFTPLIVFLSSNPEISLKKEQAKWSYIGKQGPEYWNTLDDSYHQCADGLKQSPIDIITSNKKLSETINEPYLLEFHYQNNPLKITNNGHTILNDYSNIDLNMGNEDASQKFESYMMLDSQIYSLQQFHFHTPSEHTQNGLHYPLEAHLVHTNVNGDYGVIGVYFETGLENPTLKSILNNIPNNIDELNVVDDVIINALSLIPKDQSTIYYNGSLTTPPCSEDVKWLVMQHPIQASQYQIKTMRRLIGDNARPLQNINNREIVLLK